MVQKAGGGNTLATAKRVKVHRRLFRARATRAPYKCRAEIGWWERRQVPGNAETGPYAGGKFAKESEERNCAAKNATRGTQSACATGDTQATPSKREFGKQDGMQTRAPHKILSEPRLIDSFKQEKPHGTLATESGKMATEATYLEIHQGGRERTARKSQGEGPLVITHRRYWDHLRE